ncbi:MAG: type II secretion system protein GspK [Deltaproteobacteria bacterium]|nr:type II secretion system protein GspK [Deltaproteobacteria bacterium]
MRTHGNTATRDRRGIAMLMALAVVLLLTMFMTELFFATGLELRAMTTYKESNRAHTLARAAFQALQAGLLLDEKEFYKGYRELSKFLVIGAVPLEDGLLLELEVAPQESLFNLNELGNLREQTDQDFVRQEIFFHTLEDLELPAENPDLPPELIPAEVIQGLYATIWDWLDAGDEEYIGFAAARGAEAYSYMAEKPEFQVKNAMLDQLSEIRLVKGVAESRIPWATFQKRFTALPRNPSGDELFGERINVNVASPEEIVTFLKRHKIESPLQSTTLKDIQENINQYVDKAEEIADTLVPTELGPDGEKKEKEREYLSMKDILAKMKGLGLKENYARYIFIAHGEYYRVRAVMEVGVVQARLDAVLRVTRNAESRKGEKISVIWVSLQ